MIDKNIDNSSFRSNDTHGLDCKSTYSLKCKDNSSLGCNVTHGLDCKNTYNMGFHDSHQFQM